MSLVSKSLSAVLVNQRIRSAKFLDTNNMELVLDNDTVINVSADMCESDDCELKVCEVKRETIYIADLE